MLKITKTFRATQGLLLRVEGVCKDRGITFSTAVRIGLQLLIERHESSDSES